MTPTKNSVYIEEGGCVKTDLEEKHYNLKHSNNIRESLCVRIIKKKYQCIMLLLAITFILLEIIKIILQTQQSIDDLKIILQFKYFSEKNMTLTKPISSNAFPEYG